MSWARSKPGDIISTVRGIARRPLLEIGAFLVLAAWLILTLPGSINGLPVRPLGFLLIGGCVLGIGIGARTVRFNAILVIGLAVILGVAVGRVIVAVTHRLSLFRVETAAILAAVGVAMVLVGVVIGRRRRAGPRATDALVAAAMWSFIVVDLRVIGGQAFRDLGIYLRAGRDFVEGHTVYPVLPFTSVPVDTSQFPFVYPPPTLPLFGALAMLPREIVVASWEVGSLVAAVVALRWFGVPWRWVPILLAWPPFVEGLWVGNVAVPSIWILAAGIRLPWILVLGPIFKLQLGLPALWLVRQRLWLELVMGFSIMLGLILVTLPLVGVESWTAWIRGLEAFQATRASLPIMFGNPLTAFVPYWLYLGLAAAALIAAAAASGRVGLARFAVASVVLSPTLYRHGLLSLLPGLLRLDELLVWIALGICTNSTGGWLAAGLAALGTFRRRSSQAQPTSPLGESPDVWPILESYETEPPRKAWTIDSPRLS